MTGRLHFALLRGASLLVRAAERAEWLAEWRAELCYVPSRRRTGFCLGAYRDAWSMRSHSPAPARLQSPWECLSMLAVLAVLSVFFACEIPLVRRMCADPVPAGVATIIGISAEHYGQLPGDHQNYAFYGLDRLGGSDLPVALASRNLPELLGVPLAAGLDPSATPLLITRTAWRKRFGSDPHAVGRGLTIAGRPVQIAAVLSDEIWRLPGHAEAWLLVGDESLAQEPTGYVFARVAPGTRKIGRYNCAPLTGPEPIAIFVVMMFGTVAILVPVFTHVSLGEYPVNRHALSRAGEMRRWIFLAAKIALMLPIVLFGTLDSMSLVAIAIQPQVMIVASVIAFRWVLVDQRRRCPVCLRVLTHPTTIGDSSRTLLEWYGTELVCTRGHGLLHVPEIRTSYSEQRWMHLDSSWSGLF